MAISQGGAAQHAACMWETLITNMDKGEYWPVVLLCNMFWGASVIGVCCLQGRKNVGQWPAMSGMQHVLVWVRFEICWLLVEGECLPVFAVTMPHVLVWVGL